MGQKYWIFTVMGRHTLSSLLQWKNIWLIYCYRKACADKFTNLVGGACGKHIHVRDQAMKFWQTYGILWGAGNWN